MPSNYWPQNGSRDTEDDLDLIRLLENVFSFFSRYGRLITIFSLFGLACGLLLCKVATRQYASTMLLHSNILSNTEQINIIDNWNALLKDGNYTTLSSRLNCPVSMLKKVKSLKAAEIQKLYVPNNPNGFVLTATVTDNNILDTLGDGIAYGFENNEYVHAKLVSKRSNLTDLIAKIKIEIAKLDSTKANIERSVRNENVHTSNFIFDVSTINGQLIGLNEKWLAYQDELKFANAVQVYHGFEAFEKPVSPNPLKLGLLGKACGFFFGYIVSVCMWLRRKLLTRSLLMEVTKPLQHA